MSHLQLSLTDYQDETRWRWVLSDGEGQFLADHEVSLDRQEPLYQGFADLYTYVKTYTLPTYPMQQVLEDVGEWMGQQVFGGLLETLSDEMTYPATVVQVRVPKEAQTLLFCPFELAYLDGEPFAQCGIRFVYEVVDGKAGGRKGKKSKKGKKGNNELRVLAVFSLPSQASPLNLRRERYGLAQLVDQLRQIRGAGVTLRVIQYGATRQTLKDALRQGAGWDVIHLSGHGLSGQLMLEDSEGKPDIIQADELAKLLRPTGRRVKWLTLSACLSGAGSLQQARVMLGLSSETLRTGSVYAQSAQETRLPSLAQKLSQALGCAALAMRYPVGDSFATQLALKLYESLFNDQQSLPNALQIALDRALSAEYAQSTPLSPVTPILFGTQATDLRLTPPLAPGQHEVPTTGLLNFPPEPERFVGRVLPMLRASQGLAPRSRYNGVLFYGMAGAGKTSCALELAYRHETGRFLGYVWFKAPDEGYDIHGTLGNFLQSIEYQLDLEQRGILTTHLNDPQDFSQRTLPRLQGMLRQRAILIVIDNIESLLTNSGGWRDPKWGILINALLERTERSRLVLTSRRLPTALKQHPKLLGLPIHALSLGESVLLARELDHLRLLFGDETGRTLLQRTLNMAQGHPKLLELADKMAADGQLTALTPDSTPTDNERLDAFFRTGESEQSAEDFIATLRHWTSTLTATLSPTARLLFHFLCRLEEEDRLSNIIKGNWEGFAGRLKDTTPAAVTALNQPNLAFDSSLATLVNTGLIESRILDTAPDSPSVKVGTPGVSPRRGIGVRSAFRIHPAIAETGRDEADAVVLSAADIKLGDLWKGIFIGGIKHEMHAAGPLIVEGARRAMPYLLRAKRWQEACTLLERMINRDSTPRTLSFALPVANQITAITPRPEKARILATVLLKMGRFVEAEKILREIMEQCAARENYREASSAATLLLNLLRRKARYHEALVLTKQMTDYTRRAGLGPWAQLSDTCQRLQILNELGRSREVLGAVMRLRSQIATYPKQDATNNNDIASWNPHEILLDTGRYAARLSKEWQIAIDLNTERVKLQRERGANKLEVVETRFNDYAPLLALRRCDEARTLLEYCRRVDEQESNIPGLARDFSAFAELENLMGNHATAVQFSQSALRYKYQASEPKSCAKSHGNLANYLERTGSKTDLVLPHRLATGLIFWQTNSGFLPQLIGYLANSPMPATPPSFDEVVVTVELTHGVYFRKLFDSLPKRAPNGDAAMAALWAMAKKRQAKQTAALLHLIAAVAQGNEALRGKVEALLPQLEEKGWQLSAPVQRIWAGERDADTLTVGIDASSARLVRRILELIG